MPPKVGSIRNVCEALVQNGYQVSEYALRQWVKSNILPAVYTGNKALISYDKVLEILHSSPTSTGNTN